MKISAAMVAELRQKTGLGMMECKKALQESNGDIKAAEELLRVKSGNKASKLSGRITAEGELFIAQNNQKAVVVEINCETDFVAKDENFQKFGKEVAEYVLQNNVEDIKELENEKIESLRKEVIAKLGENICVRRFKTIKDLDNFAFYKHSPKIAALVNLKAGSTDVAKDIAIHIVSFKPGYKEISQVPEDVIETEKRVAKAQAIEQGKSEEIAEKMVNGRIRKFYQEVVLLEQAFAKDEKISVSQYLKKSNAELKEYVLLVVGEGIEKKQSNYAEEVAAAASAVQR